MAGKGGRKAMVTPGVLALEHRQDITLIKAAALAFRYPPNSVFLCCR
jgi:hypothetical protein